MKNLWCPKTRFTLEVFTKNTSDVGGYFVLFFFFYFILFYFILFYFNRCIAQDQVQCITFYHVILIEFLSFSLLYSKPLIVRVQPDTNQYVVHDLNCDKVTPTIFKNRYYLIRKRE